MAYKIPAWNEDDDEDDDYDDEDEDEPSNFGNPVFR